MGADTLINRTNGQTIDQDFFNLFNRVLEGDFIGRDSSGAPTPGQNLGTPTVPWGTLRVDDLIVDGESIDPQAFVLSPNRITSGAVRATSDFPDYLRPAGSGNGAYFDLLAASVNLKIFINGLEILFTSNLQKTGLTVAPGSNNTCLINGVGLTGQDTTKNLGENDTLIPVDTMGSELTGKIGEFVALLNQATSEIMYCRINSATQLSNVRRGFFFNSAGNPIERAVLNNNDILQILSLAFIFLENDGSTIDVTYRNPAIGGNEPGSPQTGDYWLDTTIDVWKRYSGSAFVQINRTFAGAAVIDTADCIGTRPEDFTKGFRADNSIKLIPESVDIISVKQTESLISVNGEEKQFDFSFIKWDAATDFESGVSRTKDRYYWLYVTEEGKPIISDKKPYDRLGFFKGWYHPWNSWRAVGQVYNNSAGTAGEFELITSSDENLIYLEGRKELPDIAILSNNISDAANDIDFAASRFISDDLFFEAEAPAYTKQVDAAWAPGNNAGMWDTGSVPATGSFFLYKIHNPFLRLTDYIATVTLGSPTLPSGYTKKEYCGYLPRIGSINLPFTQYDKTFYLLNHVTVYSDDPFTGNQVVIAPPGVPSLAIVNVAGLTLNGAVSLHKIGASGTFPPTLVLTWSSGNWVGGASNTLNVETVFTGGFAQIGVTSAISGGSGSITIDSLGWIDYGIRG